MKKAYLTLSLVLALLATSCEPDYLDTTPTGSIDAAAAYATTTNATAAINGIYRAMIVRYLSSQGHFGHPAMMIILDLMGEDVIMPNTSTTWHYADARWQAHRSETSTSGQLPYQLYYRIIANANVALANLDNAVGSPADRDRLRGEALGLRAFSYFNLVQLYGKRYDAATRPNAQLGVPLLLAPTLTGQPRATVEEIYTQINQDLTQAATLLTATRTNKSHINLNVIRGLQARVALTQQNWTAAAQFAAQARTGFSLMSAAQYQEGFADIGNPEWMWGFDHIEDQSEAFGAFHSYMSSNFNSTVIRLTPKVINSRLYNQIPTTDVRSRMWVRTPTATNSVVPTGGLRAPFLNQKFRLPGTPSTSTMGDIPYMRVAEMFLIEAEAQARQNNTPAATTALFNLITTRDPAYVRSTRTGQTLIDEILFHRRVELWGEGFRFTDLKRANLPLDRNGANTNAAVSILFDVAPGDVQWEFLIPRRELDSNPAIVQNPLQ